MAKKKEKKVELPLLTHEQVAEVTRVATETAAKVSTKEAIQEVIAFLQTENEMQIQRNLAGLAKRISNQFNEDMRRILKEKDVEEHRDRKVKRDNLRFNTRLLILNYRKLKVHCDTIPDEIIEFEESMFDADKLSLETLMKEKIKTFKMLSWVESILKAHEDWAKKQGDIYERRYKVMDRLYINETSMKAKDLCELFNISDRQIYRDRDDAINDLSVMLFGASVIEFK